MKVKSFIILQVICLSFLWSCYSTPNSEFAVTDKLKIKALLSDVKTDPSIKYAKRFSLAENEKCRVAYLFGNANNMDTTVTFIFLKDTSLKINSIQNIFVFRSSCKKIASLSSVYTSMLCELGELSHIAAIDNIDYYNNVAIINTHKNDTLALAELSKNPELDVEKTISLNPDIVFNFGMGNPGKGPNEKILLAKIPMVLIVDHLEETPLARAEWIKFIAAFFGKGSTANFIFKAVEKNYTELKNIALQAKTKPSVFTEIKYGDIWYVPGGKSFMATFFKDANADYIWKEDANTGSLHLGFEQVYSKAKNADFWLNLSLLKTKKELYAMEKRYAEFKAYRSESLYNNNKIANEKGYSIYWETGIMFPDKILSDLILIFHPELSSQIKNDMYYYKKLD